MTQFQLKLGENMSEAELRKRYGELVRAVGHLENTLLHLAAPNPDAVERMIEPYRTRVRNLLEAHSDRNA